jgi:hypothetical protein
MLYPISADLIVFGDMSQLNRIFGYCNCSIIEVYRELTKKAGVEEKRLMAAPVIGRKAPNSFVEKKKPLERER